MRIVKIQHTKNDLGHCILIAYQAIYDFLKMDMNKPQKPAYSVTAFADFYPGENVLRLYSGSDVKEIKVGSFTEALKLILKGNLHSWSYNQYS